MEGDEKKKEIFTTLNFFNNYTLFLFTIKDYNDIKRWILSFSFFLSSFLKDKIRRHPLRILSFLFRRSRESCFAFHIFPLTVE